MTALRERFVRQLLRYMGTPYAKRYHPDPTSPNHSAPLYLDCCGLIRRVLLDLKGDFRFTVGGGNQTYQFETLPIVLPSLSHMKPGDLIFYSGKYYDPRKKPQQYDLVHVEIFLGQEEKTIGARLQRGAVQIHDSYRFQSSNYHSIKHYFRSIDTWLAGECRRQYPVSVDEAAAPHYTDRAVCSNA